MDKDVEWRPEWDGEQQALYQRARARFRGEASEFRRLRKMLGLSQAEAALRLGTTQANISKLETRRSPDLASLKALVEAQGARLTLVVTAADGNVLEIAA